MSVHGRKIEFEVTARDRAGKIGKDRRTRTIVDAKRFVSKV